MKRLAGYFIKGLFVFVPVALTVGLIVIVIKRFDNLLNLPVPGLGLAVTVALITLIGFLASNYVGRKIVFLMERFFAQLPVIRLLYSAIRDLLHAFAGEKKSFDKPVIVELTSGGPMVVGFVTREDLHFLSLSEHVAVYLPQSYNFAGQVLIFASDKVKSLDVENSKAMSFIVSGGILGK